MAQSDPSALWRGRLEILGSQVVREQLRDGKIPAENRSFVLSWLGEKDRETADFTARTTAAAERAAAAAERQTLVAQKALRMAIIANVIAIVALVASAVSLFHIFK
jgi:hypothetical protein